MGFITSIFQPGWASKDIRKAQKSFDKIQNDDNVFFEIAQRAQLSEIRSQAVERIKDEKLLLKLLSISFSPRDDVVRAVISRISAHEVLESLLSIGSAKQIVLQHITSPISLPTLLKHCQFRYNFDHDLTLDVLQKASGMDDIVTVLHTNTDAKQKELSSNFESALQMLSPEFLLQLLSLADNQYCEVEYPEKGVRAREDLIIQQLVSFNDEETFMQLIMWLTTSGLRYDKLPLTLEALNKLDVSEETEKSLLNILAKSSGNLDIEFQIARVLLKSKKPERVELAEQIVVRKKRRRPR